MRRKIIGIRAFERTKIAKQYIGVCFNIVFVGHPESPIINRVAAPVAIIIRV
jgi:hypothetical protein